MSSGIEVVTRMVEAWNAHDLDAVYGLLTDDYREYANGVLRRNSRAEARAADDTMYQMIPDYRRTVEELWGAGDRVVSRFTIFGTMADGSTLERAIGCFYGIRDGKIHECHLFFDTAPSVRPAS